MPKNTSFIGPARACVACVVILQSFLMLPLFAQSRGRNAEQQDYSKAALDELKELIAEDPPAVAQLLRRYDRIESSKRLDIFARYSIHRELVKELRGLKHPVLGEVARKNLQKRDRASFPGQVLLLKAMLSSRFPLSRAERVVLLGQAVRSRNDRLAIWGVRLLADSRWREGVDRLIAIQREEERGGAAGKFLHELVSAELYRLMGSKAANAGADKVEKEWDEMGRKLPNKPDYNPQAEGGASVFFGDRVAQRSVFCIDISSSMKEEAVIRRGGGRGSTKIGPERSGSGSKAQPKIEVVKEELVQALSGLQREHQFNIVSYDALPRIWRGGRPPKLVVARESAVRTATQFAASLAPGSGTNIHDTLVLALDVPDVESIYLLSDGAPSRGGGPDEIQRRVAAMNYLLGVRIITYGIAPAGSGAYNEALMSTLAKTNWGWYRRLND